MVGSSPPVRGAHWNRCLRSGRTGLIPARAGSTIVALFAGFAGWGSSPPVRGARGHHDWSRGHDWLIPARAGSTFRFLARPIMSGAHPRPCGEHLISSTLQPSCAGSSPPVRGAPHAQLMAGAVSGLIPARAGSTHQPVQLSLCSGAHPRPCGEHICTAIFNACVEGSSPPVRGAQQPVKWVLQTVGLIPARAGST